MNPRVSLLSIRCNSQSSHWNVRQCRLLGAGERGGQAFGHATGEKQKASKVFGRTGRLLWELLGPEFFRRGEWKLCFDKKASWPRSLTPNGLALTFREYTG